MTILKKFDTNGQEIGSEEVFMSEGDLPALMKQYGPEWVNGYRTAMMDLLAELKDDVLFDNKSNLGRSEHAMGNHLTRFYKDKELLVKNISQLIPRLEKLQSVKS